METHPDTSPLVFASYAPTNRRTNAGSGTPQSVAMLVAMVPFLVAKACAAAVEVFTPCVARGFSSVAMLVDMVSLLVAKACAVSDVDAVSGVARDLLSVAKVI